MPHGLKRGPFSLDLGAPCCSMGALALQMGSHLAPGGPMPPRGFIRSWYLGDNWLLTRGPIYLQGAPWSSKRPIFSWFIGPWLLLGPIGSSPGAHLAPGAPMPPRDPICFWSGALACSRGPLLGIVVFCWALKPILRPQRKWTPTSHCPAGHRPAGRRQLWGLHRPAPCGDLITAKGQGGAPLLPPPLGYVLGIIYSRGVRFGHFSNAIQSEVQC